MQPTFAIAYVSAKNIPAWLPEDTQEELREGDGDVRRQLAIKIGDKVDCHSDYGEPEDNSFSRDWHWVKIAIEEAYKQGRKDEEAERANDEARRSAIG